jgi:hypothetical protein
MTVADQAELGNEKSSQQRTGAWEMPDRSASTLHPNKGACYNDCAYRSACRHIGSKRP